MLTSMPLISSSKGSEQSTHGRLIFSHILLQKRAPTWDTLVVSQVKMRKDGWMPEIEEYEGDL